MRKSNNDIFFAGWKLENLEAPLVCPERPVPVLLPAHRRERSQGHHPAGERQSEGGGGREQGQQD